eukprot:6828350-Karenia_brevis.AAC.1
MIGKVKALPSAFRRLSSVASGQAVKPSGRSKARSNSKTDGSRAGTSRKQRCATSSAEIAEVAHTQVRSSNL